MSSSGGVLPHSIEAEKAVLGAILLDPDSLVHIEGVLEPKHFFLDAHQKIYSEINYLSEQNESTDLISVADRLRGFEKESELFGTSYLVELTQSCPVAQNIEYYAKIVRTDFYKRKMILACQDTIKKASTFEGTVEEFIENIEKEFLAITNQYDRKGMVSWKEVLDLTIEEIEEKLKQDGNASGVPTGFTDLDKELGGFQRGDLVIIAARPGMGKTAFALNCATNASKVGKRIALFTLEMRKEELMMRVLSGEAQVDSARLRRGDLSEEEGDRLMHGARQIYELEAHIGIDETPAITMMELRSRCRKFKKEFGLDLIIIDYLQLIGSSGNVRRSDTREREISEISGSLKALAKELAVPVIALSQLNRGPDMRPDKRPKMSDLRESGSIEQDADLVLLLFREEYYNPQAESAGTAEIIVGKNRHGSTPTVRLAFQPNFVCFKNLYKPQ